MDPGTSGPDAPPTPVANGSTSPVTPSVAPATQADLADLYREVRKLEERIPAPAPTPLLAPAPPKKAEGGMGFVLGLLLTMAAVVAAIVAAAKQERL